MDHMPLPSSLILVAIIPTPRDLEYARVLGWYRIPLRSAPKVIAIDYLAFYQPASFGDKKWQIEYLAPVKGHELVTRSDLIRADQDHPGASEEYFKIQLGPLSLLNTPIKATTWKRVTFLYTTGRYLLGAKTINDLIVQSDERKLLWKSLRERVNNIQEYQQPDMDLPPDVLLRILGIKDLVESYDMDDGGKE